MWLVCRTGFKMADSYSMCRFGPKQVVCLVWIQTCKISLFAWNKGDWLGRLFVPVSYSVGLLIWLNCAFLAHISKDEHLIKAFQREWFIPRQPCVLWHWTSWDCKTTVAMPRLSTLEWFMDFRFGLSNNLGISRRKLKLTLIPTLNASQVLKITWMKAVREARDMGYVDLFKRRRELPDINSRNFNIRGFVMDCYQLSYSRFGSRYSQDCHDSAG